jgi:hypothetical protein
MKDGTVGEADPPATWSQPHFSEADKGRKNAIIMNDNKGWNPEYRDHH